MAGNRLSNSNYSRQLIIGLGLHSINLAELSKGLSGGDILNICVNAIHAGSTDPNPERWVVTQAIIEAEIAKARKVKAEHSGEKAGPKLRIGFCER